VSNSGTYHQFLQVRGPTALAIALGGQLLQESQQRVVPLFVALEFGVLHLEPLLEHVDHTAQLISTRAPHVHRSTYRN
jgi:hypothetical protein